MKYKYKYLIIVGVVIFLCTIFISLKYNTFNNKSIAL